MNDKFFDKFLQETKDTISRRARLILIKYTFSTTLLGLGAVKINSMGNLGNLLLLVPLPILILDLVISGESFNLRRNAEFAKEKLKGTLFEDYENFIHKNPNPYLRLAHHFISLSIVAISIVLFIIQTTEWEMSLIYLIYAPLYFITVFLDKSIPKRFQHLDNDSEKGRT